MEDAWKQYEGDFNSLTDAQIDAECESARNDLAKAEEWLEAAALWIAAGKPRRKDQPHG